MPQNNPMDIIPAEIAGTLTGLFSERVRRSPQKVAYRDFDQSGGKWRDRTWQQMAQEVVRWQTALAGEGLVAGDRVAVMAKNCPEWVMLDQAALGLGLVVVPLYTADRAENAAYVLRDAGVRLLLLEDLAQWQTFSTVRDQVNGLVRVVTINPFAADADQTADGLVRALPDWLPQMGETVEVRHVCAPHDLATIIYTSGTSGRPKGVMLSHHNMLSNAYSCLQIVRVEQSDLLLSFLPLSHTFERTAGYYLPMMAGATVAHARSIQQLQEDLLIIRPTLLVSVPRIYERVYAAVRAKLAEGPALNRQLFNLAVEVGYSRFEHQQRRGPWRASHLLWPLLDKLVARKVMDKLGGRLRMAMSGGAALPTGVSRVFIGLGLPILQGYGMTESSPVVCTNTFENNLPSSVGGPIPGVSVKLGEHNALLICGPNVMLGYWHNPEATQAVLSADGWLNSGDIARIDEQGRVTITGRLKEIIVMSNGEKVPPADMEAAILRDHLFEQVMLVGDGRSYLSALVVLNSRNWESVAVQYNLDPDLHRILHDPKAEEIVLEKIAQQIREFPGYARVRRVALLTEPWTVENDMLTPTLKLRRGQVLERYRAEVEKLYAGH
ncbi:MAG: long-chain fatty acid--CoA ligase [Nitrosospira sp.]|nr:long-chain fatty acid--CoA ligase [Nitrosospira sp.]